MRHIRMASTTSTDTLGIKPIARHHYAIELDARYLIVPQKQRTKRLTAEGLHPKIASDCP